MAVYEILPTENLKLEDIRDTLNANGGTVTNDALTFFTEAANINPFSKHKPVTYNTDFCQDFDSERADYDAEWWRGWDGNCGLGFVSAPNLEEMLNLLDGDMNGWTYELPQLTFRLGDFAKYYPNAYPFMSNFNVSPSIASKNDTISGSCILVMPGDEMNLSAADFDVLKNCYFGMYLVHSGGTYTRRVTASSTIGDGGSIVNLTNDTLNTGTWTAYPFLSSAKYTSSSDIEVAGAYYPIPKVQPVTFRVVAQTTYISCQAFYEYENFVHTSVRIESLEVGSSTAKTFKNNYIYLLYSTSNFGDELLWGEQYKQLEDVEVATDAYVFDTSGLRFLLTDTLQDYKIVVSINSGDLVQEFNIFSDGSSGDIIIQ